MKKITILSLLIFAMSCTTKKHVTTKSASATMEKPDKITSSIVSASQGDTLKKIIGYKKNGQLSFIEYRKNNVRDSVYMHWYDGADQISERAEYRNGKMNGRSEEFYLNGQKKSTVMYELGLKNGAETNWYENGKKKSEGSWMFDKKNETWNYWNEKGEAVKTEEWFQGNLKDK